MKNARYKVLSTVCVTVLLVGCATQGDSTQWVKTSVNTQGKEQAIASSQCQAEAYKSVPIMPVTNNCGGPLGLTRGFARGFCEGANAKQARQTNELRAEVYEGCMLSKGWQKQKAP